MLSRFVASTLVMFVIGGFILAETYTGLVTEHKDGKITVKTRGKKKGEKGETKTLKVGKGVKITKGDETVKADDFTELVSKAADNKKGPKGVPAKITTDGEGDKETVTTIEILKAKRKGKKKDTDK